ncbi:MAG: hypothetical protein WBO09_02280, partial [Methylocystis silviterrae]
MAKASKVIPAQINAGGGEGEGDEHACGHSPTSSAIGGEFERSFECRYATVLAGIRPFVRRLRLDIQ